MSQPYYMGERQYSRSPLQAAPSTGNLTRGIMNSVSSPNLAASRGLSGNALSGGFGPAVPGTYTNHASAEPPMIIRGHPEEPYSACPHGLAPKTEEAARLLRMSSAARNLNERERAASQPVYGGGSLSRGLSLGSTATNMNQLRGGSLGANNYGGYSYVAPPMQRGFSNPPSQEREEEEEDDFVPLPPMPNEALPIVPPERLAGEKKRLDWPLHPSSPIVLALLNRRGVIPELHKPIVEYHMAEAFLDCLYALMRGSYFVRYALKHASPKERYFNIQMLPDHNERPAPFLCWYIHRTAVQMIDKVPLDDLVGITPGCKSASFRRWLVSHDIIKGCMQGHHKNRMSTRGCFTLWFYDKIGERPRSVDLLTNNMSTFTLWIKCLQGVLSVNSTSVNGMTDAAQEMQKLMKIAQQAHLQDPDYHDGESAMKAQLAEG